MLKKFGLIGGVGYLSTLDYYKGINEGYQRRLTRQSKSGENPPMVIESLNLATAYDLVGKKDWERFANLFINAVKVVHSAGADRFVPNHQMGNYPSHVQGMNSPSRRKAELARKSFHKQINPKSMIPTKAAHNI